MDWFLFRDDGLVERAFEKLGMYKEHLIKGKELQS